MKPQLEPQKRPIEQLAIPPEVFNHFRPSCEEDYNDLSVQTIIFNHPSDNRPFVQVGVHGCEFVALLDSGSNATVMSLQQFRRISVSPLKDLDRPCDLRSASGQNMPVRGQCFLPFSFKGMTKVVCTLVVENLSVDCLLGMDFWQAFGITPELHDCALVDPGSIQVSDAEGRSEESTLTPEQAKEIDIVKSLFQGVTPGKLNTTTLTEHKIVIKEEFQGKDPVIRYPYKMSPHKLAKVWSEVDRWRSMGIIEESDSDWSLNIVAVSKPDDSVRLCLDARPINERTVRDAYPLPHPGRILGSLPKARFLSTIDLKEAFLQVPLASKGRLPLSN